MTDIQQIVIQQGLGSLHFGNTKEQVLALLGEPSEREKYSLSELDKDDTEAWHYDDLDLSVSFDEEQNWRLSSIAVSSDHYLLDEDALVGKTKDELLQLAESKGWEMEEDDEVEAEDPACCLLHVEDQGLSFWLEDDIVTEVQVGPGQRK